MVVSGMTASTVAMSRFAIKPVAGPAMAPTPPAVRQAPPAFRQVEASESIWIGSALVPMGALGVTVGHSNDEVEVDFYSPSHVVVYTSASQVQVE